MHRPSIDAGFGIDHQWQPGKGKSGVYCGEEGWVVAIYFFMPFIPSPSKDDAEQVCSVGLKAVLPE